MGKVKVKSVTEADPNSSVGPILIRFEHAAVNPNLNGSTDLNKIFGAAVFQSETGATASRDMSHLSHNSFESRSKLSESRGTKRKQVVALQSDEMTYIGAKGFDKGHLPTSCDEMMKTYVALKHKKKLRLFEVTPITVSPYLKGHSYVVEKPRDTNIEKTKEEKKVAGIDLVKAFGSKKKRLTYERMEKNKVDNNDMESSINAAVDKLEVPASEPVLKDDSMMTLIPPCNREASNPYDVYHLDDIITEDELDAMEELVGRFLDASTEDIKAWRESKRYSDYFLAMWTKLQPRKHDPKSVKTAKIVLYTELLIIFLKLKHEQVRRKNVELPPEFPLWMKEKVTDNFTVMNANGTRNRPDAYKDKTCCYIMVLVVLANDLVFDVQLMSTSLNIHIKKLLTLAKAAGITTLFNPATREYRGSLKLPLPKPVEKRGRRRAIR